MGITNGQSEMVNTNKGKQVSVQLLGGDIKTLYIQGGCQMQGAFRYYCSVAKDPRKPFIDEPQAMHANITSHYYYVDPMRIIL